LIPQHSDIPSSHTIIIIIIIIIIILNRTVSLSLSLSSSSLLTYPVRHHPDITHPSVLKATDGNYFQLKESWTVTHCVTVEMLLRWQAAHSVLGCQYLTHKLYRADKPTAQAVWLRDVAPNDLVA